MAVEMFEKEVPERGTAVEGHVVLAVEASRTEASLLELPDDVGEEYPATLRVVPEGYTDGDVFLTIHTPGEDTMDVVLEIELRGIMPDRLTADTVAPVGSYPHWYDSVRGSVADRLYENLQPTVISYGNGLKLTDMPISFTIYHIYLDSDLAALFDRVIQRSEKRMAERNTRLNPWGSSRPENPLIYNPELRVEEEPYTNPHSTDAVTDHGTHALTTRLFLEAAAVSGADEYCQYHPGEDPAVSISVPPHLDLARGDTITFERLIREHPFLRPKDIRNEFETRRESHREQLLSQLPALQHSTQAHPIRKQPDRGQEVATLDSPSPSETALRALPPTCHPRADSETIAETAALVDDSGTPNVTWEVGGEYTPEDLRVPGESGIVDLSEESLPLSEDAFTLLTFTRRWDSPPLVPDPEDATEEKVREAGQGPYRFHASVTIVYAGTVFIDCQVQTHRWDAPAKVHLYREPEYPSQLVEVVKEYVRDHSPVPLQSPMEKVENPYTEAPLETPGI
jgi:hypothetical protein